MMGQKITKILFVLLVIAAHCSYGQRYKASSGSISFFSEEILEDITAINHDVQSIFDSETGQIVFSVPIRSFEFEKSLMQEHFNEKYMESDKFPTATFRGVLSNYRDKKSGEMTMAEGDLEIHGQKQPIKVPGTVVFTDDRVEIKAKFKVLLEDYKIVIPKLMFQKIAEEIEITIDLRYDKM